MKQQRSLSHILVLSLLAAALLMTAVIAGCYWATDQALRRQSGENAEETLRDTVKRIDVMLDETAQNGRLLTDNNTVNRFMTGTALERFEERDEIRLMLSSLVNFSGGAINAYLVTQDRSCMPAAPTNADSAGSAVYLASRRIMEDHDLTQPFRQSYVTRCYQVLGATYYGVVVPVYPSSFVYSPETYCGALLIVMQASSLAAELPQHDAQSMLVAEGSIPLAGDRSILLDTGSALSLTVPGTSWTVYYHAASAQAPDYTRALQQVLIIIGLSMLAALSLLMVVQYRQIVNPIINIAQQVSDPSSDEKAVVNPVGSRNELSLLTDGINTMKTRLHTMSEAVLHAQVQSYEDQVTLLQAQINPHFLYNNFECIRGMAAEGNVSGVRDLASSIAAIYRYCCKGGRMVPLQRELDCVAQYARIIGLRYDHRYRIEMQAEPDALETELPRMILQPLVENAVSHGLARSARTGVVLVRAWCESGALCIRIEDTGTGMTPEQLALYNDPATHSDPDAKEHMGVNNVRHRLYMMYGERCSIRFANQPGSGLMIDIRLADDPK